MTSGIITGQHTGDAGTKDGICIFPECVTDPYCGVWSQFAEMFMRQAVHRYGYFELRAKFPTVYRATWWMVGFPDGGFDKLAEIDIFEFSNSKPWEDNCAHFGVHPWDDTLIDNETNFFEPDSCSNYHRWLTYSFLWDEGNLSLSIHNDLGQLLEHYHQPVSQLRDDYYSDNLEMEEWSRQRARC